MAMLNNQRVHLVFRDSPKSEPRFFFCVPSIHKVTDLQFDANGTISAGTQDPLIQVPDHGTTHHSPYLTIILWCSGHKWLRAWRILGFPGSPAYPKAVHLVGLCSAMFVPNTNYWYWLILVCLHIILQFPTSAYTGCTRCQSSAINLVPLFLIKHLHVWKNHSHNPKILSG